MTPYEEGLKWNGMYVRAKHLPVYNSNEKYKQFFRGVFGPNLFPYIAAMWCNQEGVLKILKDDNYFIGVNI